MRKLVFLTAMVAMMSTSAFAAGQVGEFALGWVDANAPIGFRYQFAEKVAADVGVGFASYDGGDTEFRVHVGVPIALVAHGRSALAFRPGFSLVNTSPDDSDADSYMDFVLHGWLAYNIMITDNVCLTAAHGVNVEFNGERKVNDTVIAESTTDIMTMAADATEVGLYFWF